MTIIAFKDATMCADSLTESASGLRCGVSDKIVRCRNGSLAGATGPAGACAKFLAWAVGHSSLASTKDHPGRLCDADEFQGIIAYPGGLVAYFDGCGEAPDFTRAPFYAIGNAASMGVAMGVMALGHSARQAVQTAIELTTCCGPPILELQFQKERRDAKSGGEGRRVRR